MKIAIVCGSFHQTEVQKMLEWATNEASKQGLTVEEVAWVPGAMEVPLALNRLLSRDDSGLLQLKGSVVENLVERASLLQGYLDKVVEVFIQPGDEVLGNLSEDFDGG